MERMPELITQLVCAFLGSLSFTVIFNLHGARLLSASLGGLFTWGVCLALGIFIPNEVGCYFGASVFASIYSNVLARVQKAPVTVFFVPSVIPLIPGSGLYYSMHDALYQNWPGFIETGSHTLALAAAIAGGMVLVSSAGTIIDALVHRRDHIRRAVESRREGPRH